MVAPTYAEACSEFAHQIGLGQKRRPSRKYAWRQGGVSPAMVLDLFQSRS
jgi:hypothetical protein